MKYSAEIRWFSNNREINDGIVKWFADNGKVFTGENLRTDIYLAGKNLLAQGIKFRENRLEIKVLVQDWGQRQLAGNNSGRENMWCKYEFDMSPDDKEVAGIIKGSASQQADIKRDWIKVDKERLLVKYAADTDGVKKVPEEENPEQGCNVEITKIRIRDEERLTFGFEASGKEEDLQVVLEKVVNEVLTEMKISGLNAECSFSYPDYIASLA